MSEERREKKAESDKAPEKNPEKKVFLGVHLDPDVHQRLYRLKASLEYETGKFYGLGKLLGRVIEEGLRAVEADTKSVEARANA